MSIAFIDLAAQQARIKADIDSGIAAVLSHGKYIMGPEVKQFEANLSEFVSAKHTLSCANGTDALLLALMAINVRGGDAIFVPSFTFAASAEVVPCMGAVPIFVDVCEDTYNIDPESLKRAIKLAKDKGLNPKAVIAVDLFGLAADFDKIIPIAHEEGMVVIDDAAQGFAATYNGKRCGAIADITTTSFFPAKPLGCYGDGGAVFTENDEYAMLMESYRVHGKGAHKYDNERFGMNSRLDTLQAAILLPKLAIYQDELDRRQKVAEFYSAELHNHFQTPMVPQGSISVWAQYTLQASSKQSRDAVMAKAKEVGVPTVVYYPLPLHQQTAYRDFPIDPNGLPVSEKLAERVFSLPMHPYLDEETAAKVVEALI